MAPAFLETTALIDLVFKCSQRRQKVTTACSRGARRITSQYVIYELARGFLRNLILLYNRALTVRLFSDLLTYANRIRRKAHYAATVTESFALYLQESLRVGLLAAPAGKSLDEFMLDEFKGHLRRQIRHGWTEAIKCVNEIIDEVGCRGPIPSPYVDKEFFRQDLLAKLCGVASACGLKRYLGHNRHDFNGLHVHLGRLKNADEETLKCIHAIQQLCRDAERDFERHQCYRLADALIVHEAPLRGRLISSNRRHIEPACNFLNRQADFYS